MRVTLWVPIDNLDEWRKLMNRAYTGDKSPEVSEALKNIKVEHTAKRNCDRRYVQVQIDIDMFICVYG